MTQQWSLRARVTALCVIVASVFALLAAAAATTALANRSEYDSLLNRIGPLRISAQQLQSALLDQETGLRGYALRGTDEDLAPYQNGLAAEATLLAQMRENAAGRPEVLNQLDEIATLAVGWRRDVAEPVIAAVRTGGTEAAQALLTESTRARFDAIRSAMTSLQGTLTELRDASAARIRDTGDTLILLLIIAAVLVVFAGAGLLALLRRLVTNPVTELAAQVRQVADGHYDQRIHSDGPPEVARLARDVDGMRRQIASDLAQVQAIRQQLEDANAQLEVQAAELTRSNRDLEQFAYVASHDLQEPLRKVASFCQLLQRRYAGQLDERADQYIGFAVNGAQRMQRLINDLLAFSRIGRATSGFGPVDLNTVVTDSTAQLENTIEHSGAQVRWTDLPVVYGEETLLGTLMANLIGNSIKFHRPDEPPRIEISARPTGDEWEISVADNGIGVAPEYAEKVFVIFQRLHPKEAYPGTGIGLAMAKKIVEYHGGHIWLDPDVEVGTTVRFTLRSVPVPVSPAPGEAAPEPSATEPSAPGTGESPPDDSVADDSVADALAADRPKETVA